MSIARKATVEADKCLVVAKFNFTLSLKPHFACKARLDAGIADTLARRLFRYDSRLKGVILAYKEVKLLETLGTMMPGSGSTTIRFPAQAKLLLYKPIVGSLVDATVNYIGASFVSLLVCGVFPVVVYLADANKLIRHASREEQRSFVYLAEDGIATYTRVEKGHVWRVYIKQTVVKTKLIEAKGSVDKDGTGFVGYGGFIKSTSKIKDNSSDINNDNNNNNNNNDNNNDNDDKNVSNGATSTASLQLMNALAPNDDEDDDFFASQAAAGTDAITEQSKHTDANKKKRKRDKKDKKQEKSGKKAKKDKKKAKK